ncbi:ZIP family metal transporter [Candidatus Giovannonibacteria bacterium]|nr:ZIP family metal transporter [Candidatus Giovannonibacteria bacterium]
MSLLGAIILSSFAAAFVSLIGGLLPIYNGDKVKGATHYVVSFAIGALFSVSFLDLLPEAIEMSSVEYAMPFVLVGVLFFFLLEKFIFWYHCHDGECQVHAYSYLVLWGDFLHNFVDGIILGLTFLVDMRLGFITTIAIILHEIPQEIGDFGILMHGGLSRSKALLYNFLSALSVVAGGILTYFLGSSLEPFLPASLAMVAGAFIYLAAVDLMPELHESTRLSHSLIQIIFILAGAFFVIAPGFFLGH